jgi:hypothetical protein
LLAGYTIFGVGLILTPNFNSISIGIKNHNPLTFNKIYYRALALFFLCLGIVSFIQTLPLNQTSVFCFFMSVILPLFPNLKRLKIFGNKLEVSPNKNLPE